MKRLIMVCTLVALACTSLHAQNTESNYDLQQSTMRTYEAINTDLQQRDRQNQINSLVNLTKLHDSLAKAWKNLGLSPAAAQEVANAYQPNLATKSPHGSLKGRSSQEIAAMLQSALNRKDYMLANQTLIDYERIELHAGSGAQAASESCH